MNRESLYQCFREASDLTRPNIAGEAITNLQDTAILLLMHLRDGMYGDNKLMSRDAVLSLQVDRTSESLKVWSLLMPIQVPILMMYGHWSSMK